MIAILLFVGGFGFGWLWFTRIGLAIVYGAPRAAYHALRGSLLARAPLVFLSTVLPWSILFVGLALVLRVMGMADQILNSRSCFAGLLLGVFFGLAAAFTDGGRAALNDGFWQAMIPYRRDVETSSSVPQVLVPLTNADTDRIYEYFVDATRVFVYNEDPGIRLAALTAAKMVAAKDRSDLVYLLRTAVAEASDGDRNRCVQLTRLAEEIIERDWDAQDILQAKRRLRNANRTYAVALDVFDSRVFRRTHPEVFGEHDAADVHDGGDVSDDEIIGAYSRVLERRKGMFSDESLLPFSRQQISAALRRAAVDKVYQLGGSAMAIATAALDTFVPSDRLVSSQALFEMAMEHISSDDESTFMRWITVAPEIERRAVLAVIGIGPPAL
ncbi:MAG: hypothetical protein Q7J25_12635 [Vicinamibacterales bacterium]|nr:hypothetical protein [Vicinamibacterales bacterium]